MEYARIHKRITRQLHWRYFFSIDYEDIEDCVSEAIAEYIKLINLGSEIQTPEGWIYTVAKKKVGKKVEKGKKYPHQNVDDLNEKDTSTVQSAPVVQMVAWEDWEFEETEMVVVKGNTLYVKIHSELGNKLYNLFLKHLKGKCLEIFLRMLMRWEDEDIQEEMEHKTLDTFRQVRHECMKKLRKKLKEEGEWVELFGRIWKDK